ncbi:hypothetical protein FW774_07795 [Pedobacter sp. BS3]|uniref:addiction module protein n=1 Tax=Pedobacter sp. BS3 TaxID=2567937 RepID=UPI0011F032D6|nr:addiction module protein [Pedobacter sp. BS3]TZF84870.1 hypothetical protein FW774_07795 [Pedobacter sp. BS3]
MDLATRKYNFIQELIDIDKESILDALEKVLKQKKEESQELSDEIRQELDDRLASYHKNPNDLLDWESVKKDW